MEHTDVWLTNHYAVFYCAMEGILFAQTEKMEIGRPFIR